MLPTITKNSFKKQWLSRSRKTVLYKTMSTWNHCNRLVGLSRKNHSKENKIFFYIKMAELLIFLSCVFPQPRRKSGVIITGEIHIKMIDVWVVRNEEEKTSF